MRFNVAGGPTLVSEHAEHSTHDGQSHHGATVEELAHGDRVALEHHLGVLLQIGILLQHVAAAQTLACRGGREALWPQAVPLVEDREGGRVREEAVVAVHVVLLRLDSLVVVALGHVQGRRVLPLLLSHYLVQRRVRIRDRIMAVGGAANTFLGYCPIGTRRGDVLAKHGFWLWGLGGLLLLFRGGVARISSGLPSEDRLVLLVLALEFLVFRVLGS